MANIKIVLRKEQKKDGTFPLAIRVTKDRKSSYIYLDYSIKLTDWDEKTQRVKKSYPNSARLNNYLIKKLSEANATALEQETTKTHVSAEAVRKKIKPSAGLTFFAQAKVYLENLKAAGKYNQYTSDKPRINHFRNFVGHDIAFQDISATMLERFRGYCVSNLSLSERSAVNCLVTVRSVFSHAIKDNIIDDKYYPFGKGKVKIKFPESNKVGLTAEEITKLEETEIKDERLNHYRNLFLISFYFAGMRVSDVLRLRHSDFKNERLHYTMGKNGKSVTLKIPERAQKILQHYEQFKENADDLVFPELKRLENLNDKFKTQRAIAFATSRIDKFLRTDVAKAAGIEKKLTMHIARHTFGNIAGDKIPVQMLQKLYRHTKLETTIGYQSNFIHKDADDALDTVLAFEP